MGCSTHSVPSLSKTAMRSGSATKSGVPSLVTFSTKATMAAFGAVSFHDGRGSEPLAAIAGASPCGEHRDGRELQQKASRDVGHCPLPVCQLRVLHIMALNQTGGPGRPPVALISLLVTRLVPDRRVDLPLHGLEIEGSRVLHRRVVNCRQGQFRDFLLNADEPPELASIEVVHVAATEIIQALLADRGRPLEWILADIDHGRHVRRDLRARPALRLLDRTGT